MGGGEDTSVGCDDVNGCFCGFATVGNVDEADERPTLRTLWSILLALIRPSTHDSTFCQT